MDTKSFKRDETMQPSRDEIELPGNFTGDLQECVALRIEEIVGTTSAVIFYTNTPWNVPNSDCVMAQSELVVYDTGTGTFDADVASSDDNDTFYFKAAIFGSDNKAVLTLPSSMFWFREMGQHNTWYKLHQTFDFDKTLFPNFNNAVFYAKC